MPIDYKKTLLLIGAPGSGKTMLSYGVYKYLSFHSELEPGSETTAHHMLNEYELNFDQGIWPTGSRKNTANLVHFSIRERNMVRMDRRVECKIIDWPGEEIMMANVIDRNQTNTEFLEKLVVALASSGTEAVELDRRELTDIVLVIGPDTSRKTYPSLDSREGLQSHLKTIRELTGRITGFKKISGPGVWSYRRRFKKIRVHVALTKASMSVNVDDTLSLVRNISPDLATLVKKTKGGIYHCNVLTEQGGRIEIDWAGITSFVNGVNLWHGRDQA